MSDKSNPNPVPRGSRALTVQQLAFLKRLANTNGGTLTAAQVARKGDATILPSLVQRTPPEVPKDSLVGRGLIKIVVLKEGPPSYRITPKGRQMVKGG